MSAKVKLSGKLPGDEVVNGLDAIRDQLLEVPEKVRVSLIWHDVVSINHDVATGEDVPRVEVRKWIPIGTADAIPQELIDFALKADAERLGREPLPFESTEPADLNSGPVPD